MKLRLLLTLFTISLLLFGVTAISATEDDMHDMAADHCDNPTAELTVQADQTSNAFTEEEYEVDKNTCYTLYFKNPSFNEHDLSIDETENDDFHFHEVHIHVASNTDGHDGDGIKSMNIMTPDFDTELDIYCSVSGHRNNGMEATLIVGDGDSFLPFNLFYGFLGMFATILIFRSRRH